MRKGEIRRKYPPKRYFGCMQEMAYVSVPKDLTKVKNKIAFNLTKRQIICFSIALAVGLPFYFLSRGVIGNSNAATGMVFLMLPAFLFAMYEKDGMPLENVLMNIITVQFLKPDIRCYETENIYEMKEKAEAKKRSSKPSVKKGGQRLEHKKAVRCAGR